MLAQNVLKSPATITGLAERFTSSNTWRSCACRCRNLRDSDQEHADIVELEFDDQALDAGVEVVKRSPSTRGAARKALDCLFRIGTNVLNEFAPYLHW